MFLVKFVFNQRLHGLRIGRKVAEGAFQMVTTGIDEDFIDESTPSITAKEREVVDLRKKLTEANQKIELLEEENCILRNKLASYPDTEKDFEESTDSDTVPSELVRLFLEWVISCFHSESFVVINKRNYTLASFKDRAATKSKKRVFSFCGQLLVQGVQQFAENKSCSHIDKEVLTTFLHKLPAVLVSLQVIFQHQILKADEAINPKV